MDVEWQQHRAVQRPLCASFPPHHFHLAPLLGGSGGALCSLSPLFPTPQVIFDRQFTSLLIEVKAVIVRYLEKTFLQLKVYLGVIPND